MCLCVIIINQSFSLIYFSSMVILIKQIKTIQMGGRFCIFVCDECFCSCHPFLLAKSAHSPLSWAYANSSQSLASSSPTNVAPLRDPRQCFHSSLCASRDIVSSNISNALEFGTLVESKPEMIEFNSHLFETL